MTPFLKLEAGENIIRIITPPFQYYGHTNYVLKGKQSFEQKLKCFDVYEGPGKCSLCKRLSNLISFWDGDNNTQQPRWMFGVLYRKDNNVYILDANRDICKSIQKMAKDPDWGDPKKYDIMIILGDKATIAYPKPSNKYDTVEASEELLEELKELSLPKSDDGECVKI